MKLFVKTALLHTSFFISIQMSFQHVQAAFLQILKARLAALHELSNIIHNMVKFNKNKMVKSREPIDALLSFSEVTAPLLFSIW